VCFVSRETIRKMLLKVCSVNRKCFSFSVKSSEELVGKGLYHVKFYIGHKLLLLLFLATVMASRAELHTVNNAYVIDCSERSPVSSG
jgi:hypothetical protein